MDYDRMSMADRARVVGAVLGSSLVLTASFLGIVALVSGEIADLPGRLPFYVLGAAVVFTVAMFALEDPGDHGVPIVTTTAALSVLGFVLLTFGAEGVRYAILNPTVVLTANVVVYFLAAGLICTALGYWALHHWREFL
ncbi:MAG: hypothetical protein ABEJ86_01780 [Halococcoides sp.]